MSARLKPLHQKKSVLIVDDLPEIRAIQRAVFCDEEFVVTAAANGPVTIFALATVHPDVILLDIHFPNVDGVASATAYQAQSGPRAPIVVFSTAAESHRIRAIRPASVIPEPCNLDAMLATVERQLTT